jgi:cytidine deaminase
MAENSLSQAEKEMLVKAALEARTQAYAPYSKYAVGAAVLAEDGRVYSGANIENAAYPSGICAERVAIFKAVSTGVRKIQAIAVATENGGSPCGSCRQVIREFSKLGMPVLILDASGTIVLETSLEALLPHSFGPEDLSN